MRRSCVVLSPEKEGAEPSAAKVKAVSTPRCVREASGDWYNASYELRAFPGGAKSRLDAWKAPCGLGDGTNGTLGRTCFVGASHARKLTWAAERVARRTKASHRASFKHVDAQFPLDYFSKAKPDLRECAFVVVALGQWAAGWPLGAPHGADQFEAEMEAVAQDLAALERQTGAVVALRSIDFSPLGYKQLQCPPTDWRTPFLVDEYNARLAAVARRTKVPFIDTSSLLRPIWDMASDWNHLDFAPSDHQAAAILEAACALPRRP